MFYLTTHSAHFSTVIWHRAYVKGPFIYIYIYIYIYMYVYVMGWYVDISMHVKGARCSSVVRTFAHGAMGRRIEPSWWTH